MALVEPFVIAEHGAVGFVQDANPLQNIEETTIYFVGKLSRCAIAHSRLQTQANDCGQKGAGQTC
jgi:hypothetical protein